MPYRISIDRGLWTGSAECVTLAPDVFQLDDENVSIVVEDQLWPR